MKSYEAARGYFDFLTFIAWIGIVGGLVLALAGGGMVAATVPGANPVIGAILGAIPGALLCIFGSMALVNVQMGRASVDSAEYAQQSLKIARDQFEISKEMLLLAKRTDPVAEYSAANTELSNISFDTNGAVSPPTPDATEVAAAETLEESGSFQHGGYQIEETVAGFVVEGRTFPSLPRALQFAAGLPPRTAELSQELEPSPVVPAAIAVPPAPALKHLAGEPTAAPDAEPPTVEYIDHHGIQIEKTATGFLVDGEHFSLLSAAKSRAYDLAQERVQGAATP